MRIVCSRIAVLWRCGAGGVKRQREWESAARFTCIPRASTADGCAVPEVEPPTTRALFPGHPDVALQSVAAVAGLLCGVQNAVCPDATALLHDAPEEEGAELRARVKEGIPRLLSAVAAIATSTAQSAELHVALERHVGPTYLCSFADVLRNGPLPEGVVAGFTQQLLLQVRELHASGGIHGLISPESVVLLRDYSLRLVSRDDMRSVVDEDDSGILDAGVLERHPYVAPEVSDGDADATAASDVWSIGALACCMCSGHAPVPTGGGGAGDAQLPWGPHADAPLHGGPQAFVPACLAVNPAERPDVDSLLQLPFMCDAPSADAAAAEFRALLHALSDYTEIPAIPDQDSINVSDENGWFEIYDSRPMGAVGDTGIDVYETVAGQDGDWYGAVGDAAAPTGAPRPPPAARAAELDTAAREFLARFGLGRYAPALAELGAATMADLRLAEFDDLLAAGIPRIRARVALAELRKTSTVACVTNETTTSAAGGPTSSAVSRPLLSSGAPPSEPASAAELPRVSEDSLEWRAISADGKPVRLGVGAFGEVWRGIYHGRTGEAVPVAIKVQHRRGPGDRVQTLQNVLDEATVHAQVGNHPNIVSLVGLCRPSSVRTALPWIVLELVADSRSLDELVASRLRERDRRVSAAVDERRGDSSTGDAVAAPDGAVRAVPRYTELSDSDEERVVRGGGAGDGAGPCPLPVLECLTIFRQIARALAHMHAHGVTHRDLAARNVLVSAAGDVKVGDFGLARQGRGAEEGSSVGPVAWESPESVNYKVVGPEGDVWALGCVMCEVLSGGKPPWGGMRNSDIFQKMRLTRLTPADHMPRGAAGDLAPVLTNVFQRMPAARPTAADLVEEFTDAIERRRAFGEDDA